MEPTGKNASTVENSFNVMTLANDTSKTDFATPRHALGVSRRRFVGGLFGFGILAGLPQAARAAAATITAHYAITHSLQGDIGRQTVRQRLEGNRNIVEINTDIAVKLGIVTVFRYESERREEWRGGRLVAYDASTSRKGAAPIVVKGRAVGGVFRVDRPEGPVDAPADIVTSNAWDIRCVARGALLHGETGTLLDISATPHEAEALTLAGQTWNAQSHRIEGDIRRTVWYAPDGLWLRTQERRQGIVTTELAELAELG